MALNTKISQEFLESLSEIPGLDVEALAKSLEEAPSTAIRINRRKLQSADERVALYPEMEEDMEKVEWCRDGYYLPERPVFTLNPLLHVGAFYVQDASSMIYQQIAEKLIARISEDDGETVDSASPAVLDFCAAPGGKTTAIINALPDDAMLVANEYVAARGKILRENLEKWGFPNVITTGSSSAEYAELPEMFDIVAVDAPCSGEGMMRKDEEARRQWSRGLIRQCASLQREILADVVNCLKPGGYLIYSTCTFNLHENEENAEYIVNELGLESIGVDDLGLEGIARVARGVSKDVARDVGDTGSLRFMPHITQGEGLFVAVFRKKRDGVAFDEENEDSAHIGKGNNKGKKKGKKGDGSESGSGTIPESAIRKELSGYFNKVMGKDMEFEATGDNIMAIPSGMKVLREKLTSRGVRVTGTGLPAASVKGRDMIPDSRMVLSAAFMRESMPEVELDLETALKFLRRESFPLPPDTEKGFVVVKYQSQPLGIMKNLGTRANNLFPQSWKIKHL